MSKKLQVFNVSARLNLVVQIDIKAESYEDALAQSKELKEQEFVKFQGEFMDGNVEIVGIGKDRGWDLDR